MMRSIKTISVFLLVISLITLLACKSDDNDEHEYSSALIEGRWNLVSANVDGEETDRLRGLYFVFLPDTSMQTNILGSERNYKYSLTGEGIQQHSDPPLSYEIRSQSDSLLTMISRIRGADFTIYLSKAKPNR